MKKIAVIPARGIGDSLLMHIVSHTLSLEGCDVTTFTDHLEGFGPWFSNNSFEPQTNILPSLQDFDSVILQHDNSLLSKTIKSSHKRVFCFYGSFNKEKHGSLTPLDYICNPKQSMRQNISSAIDQWFHLPSYENGLLPPPGLIHQKHTRRIAIHPGSSSPHKNWDLARFNTLSNLLKEEGYNPVILPIFPSLASLASFIYESKAFIGNDSGPGHLASCLNIPSLIIGESHKQMLLWKPDWLPPTIATPPRPISHFKWTRPHWKRFLSPLKILKQLKTSVLV